MGKHLPPLVVLGIEPKAGPMLARQSYYHFSYTPSLRKLLKVIKLGL
jgi:hypothetical protein